MKKLMPLLFAALFLTLPMAQVAYAAKADVFKDPELGLKLKKPGDWVFLTVEEMIAATGGDPQAGQGLVVTAARYPEPTPKLNPTAQVYQVPMATTGVVPESVLDAMIRQIGMGSQVFEIEEPLTETRISGHPAASARIRHSSESASDPEAAHLVITRMWTVVRGTDLFIVVLTGPAEGPDVSDHEFKKIFKSLRIR